MVAKVDYIKLVTLQQREQELTRQRLEISSILQTTLDLSHLFYLFSEQIRSIVPHDGYYYEHPLLNETVEYGMKAKNTCYTDLHLNSVKYGTLVFYRNKAFSTLEKNTINSLVDCLVYPLKNITLYQQALLAAHTDPLTQLANRRALSEDLRRECILSYRKKTPLSLILIDLDHFKDVNDQYGHTEGDRLLVAVANCLRQSVRACDVVYRYGGEEFLIVLNQTPISGANLIAERIRIRLGNLTDKSLQSRPVTASLGIASLAKNEDAQSLLQRADKAMYTAKMMGRNRIENG
ncbi:MAG TPA: GGDEF domain-containing protein [Crenotrichaceae bacterium]|nr:GGDEF domain-containing protein [Crenotrichaceae bacterium]